MAEVDGGTLAPFAWLFGTLGAAFFTLLCIAGALIGVVGYSIGEWSMLAVGAAVALVGCIGMGLLFAFSVKE